MTFHDNSEEIIIKVPFQKTVTEYKQKENIPENLQIDLMEQKIFNQMFRIKTASLIDKSINHSFCKFYFRLHNNGNSPIEDYKVFLKFDGEFESIDTISKGGGFLTPVIHYTYNTFINNDERTGKIIPDSNILVSEDSVGFDDIEIKPVHESRTININWKLVSKDYKEEGNIKLNIDVEIKIIHKTVIVKDLQEERIVEGEIKDYITDRDNED